MAVCLTVLMVASALVLDFGLVKIDRQVNKSVADSATTAGLRSMLSANLKSYPYRGVCGAINYLRANDDRFSTALNSAGVATGVTAASGTWTRGDGSNASNGCVTTSSEYNATCVKGAESTFARFDWSGSYQGSPLTVRIAGGYRLDIGSGSADYAEETLPAVAADNDDAEEGCYQLAVIITEARKPGLGSLATSANLMSTVRSVGRIASMPGGDAPAMLLLRRTGCPILATGSNSGGSYVRVYGAVSTDGRTQAGTIHADSDGSACTGGSNANIFLGKAAGGIVAYAAPLDATSLTTPDPAKPGLLSSVAGSLGITGGVIRDALANAHSATGISESAPGTSLEATGRPIVTRSLIDDRYLGLGTTPFGIRKAVSTAQSVFSSINSATAASTAGWKIIPNCDPTNAQMTAADITPTSLVYVDCSDSSGYKGTQPINGETVLFAGPVKPPSTVGTSVSLPSAKKVYIVGQAGSDALSLGTNSALRVNTSGNTDAVTGACTTGVSASKAVMVLKAGQLKQTGGSLQLCRTTVIAMGNSATACLPTQSGTAPNPTPCGTTPGDSQISLTGTSTTIDWVAPNTIDITTDANGDPLPAAVTAWRDENGPEDLALWTESYGGSSSPTYSMGGGGVMTTVGVFMAPNAAPFTISGGAVQDLRNAQYIATSINLNGSGTAIKMRVDPNSAVTLPRLEVVGLVR